MENSILQPHTFQLPQQPTFVSGGSSLWVAPQPTTHRKHHQQERKNQHWPHVLYGWFFARLNRNSRWFNPQRRFPKNLRDKLSHRSFHVFTGSCARLHEQDTPLPGELSSQFCVDLSLLGIHLGTYQHHHCMLYCMLSNLLVVPLQLFERLPSWY